MELLHFYLVTVKYPRRKDHDPTNKQTGFCPASRDAMCTDRTGAHHTMLIQFDGSIEHLRREVESFGRHVTRIEEAYLTTLPNRRLGWAEPTQTPIPDENPDEDVHG